MPSSLFPAYLLNPTLPLFVFFLFSSFHCSINTFSPFCSFSFSVSQHLFPFLLSRSFFSSSHPHLSSSESHWSRGHQRHVSPSYSSDLPRQADFKARYPKGRIQSSMETYCTLSGKETVEKVKTRIRTYVILSGMYGETVMRYEASG